MLGVEPLTSWAPDAETVSFLEASFRQAVIENCVSGVLLAGCCSDRYDGGFGPEKSLFCEYCCRDGHDHDHCFRLCRVELDLCRQVDVVRVGLPLRMRRDGQTSCAS